MCVHRPSNISWISAASTRSFPLRICLPPQLDVESNSKITNLRIYHQNTAKQCQTHILPNLRPTDQLWSALPPSAGIPCRMGISISSSTYTNGHAPWGRCSRERLFDQRPAVLFLLAQPKNQRRMNEWSWNVSILFKIHKNNSLCQEKKINLEEFLYISSSKSPPEHVDSLDHAQGTCHAMDMPKNSEILMSRDPGSMRLNLGAQVLQETALLQQKVEDCGKKLPS